MKYLLLLLFVFSISCNEGRVENISFIKSVIKIENNYTHTIYIIANDWFLLNEKSLNNKDQKNIWNAEFLSNKIFFSQNQYTFNNREIIDNDLKSIIKTQPLLYKIEPNRSLSININISDTLIKPEYKYLNYQILYIDSLDIVNKLSKFCVVKYDSLVLNFDTNILQLSGCFNKININDKILLESISPKYYLDSLIIEN